MTGNSWHDSVPDAVEFEIEKKRNLKVLAEESNHRTLGLKLLQDVSQNGFGHKNNWMGVPIIRLPEDLILQQEIVWREKPDLIIEVGVARGGGLIFNASLQEMCGIKPNVVGVDNKIFAHTRDAIESSRYHSEINLLEGDSISTTVVKEVGKRTYNCKKALLILDSDHASDHVLSELRSYVPIIPAQSIVMVCDTLIDEYQEGTYPNRTWSNGKGPLDAINLYLKESNSVQRFMERETKALVLSEIRDGILRKVSN